ncbi:2-keto-4-pentenoate hydratase/2-oxohepta-3-ene-1,7-dioic acid hydratase (catechol pathway) [Rubidibacter lacunae KORDI 51-2]|uniref:2-keto-4-pentenoate hydratase/2-oxohepta-3-ene-1,7-dioic acid hydratase (Catechol pathway) n=1 Tax=Rubidibacter lacunae KORDI 51-2 TaxID=582515 RepID=U5D9D8_9CHRO|nr:fumarylacetoacetate hydrolase family protein [Rubidibacter lacunae]ERN41203.1 2-keto-4-pentenoate hydratase/2-oxohepta-3-ene-1,7-dioic acid hydratase (catechol pathway) [Rubidibacter lacunae KORDI 51-2]
MVQRYVRVRTIQGQTCYGLLEADRSVLVLDAPPWIGGQPTDLKLDPDSYQLLAPCAPTKIVAVGKNYRDRAAEMGAGVPEQPHLFLKPPTAATADGEPIYYPSQSEQIDYEGSLALVVGVRVSRCSLEQARKSVWGYTIANDVTARDLLEQDKQWTRAKGFDSFCPLGPWSVRDLSASARIQTFVNDEAEPRQSASIGQMVFGIDTLIAYISEIMTLLPGDIVLTGTPPGVGPLEIGDRIRVEIEGIGQLTNPVVARPDLPA